MSFWTYFKRRNSCSSFREVITYSVKLCITRLSWANILFYFYYISFLVLTSSTAEPYEIVMKGLGDIRLYLQGLARVQNAWKRTALLTGVDYVIPELERPKIVLKLLFVFFLISACWCEFVARLINTSCYGFTMEWRWSSWRKLQQPTIKFADSWFGFGVKRRQLCVLIWRTPHIPPPPPKTLLNYR